MSMAPLAEGTGGRTDEKCERKIKLPSRESQKKAAKKRTEGNEKMAKTRDCQDQHRATKKHKKTSNKLIAGTGITEAVK